MVRLAQRPARECAVSPVSLPVILKVVLVALLNVGAVSNARAHVSDWGTQRAFGQIARISAVLDRDPTRVDECSLVEVLGDSAVNELRDRVPLVRSARRDGAEAWLALGMSPRYS